MGYAERANLILELLKKNGVVQIPELCRLLGVSAVTIRKDLQRMETEGLLRRTHGGAALRSMGAQLPNPSRKIAMERIAERVAREIQPGDCVIMNAGNTTLLTARKLLGRKGITIITNSIGIARELAQQADIKVIFLGGEVSTESVFTYGWDAVAQLEQYKANKLLLSASGLSCMTGVTTRHMEAADLLRKMISRAQSVIVLADDTKIGFESFYHVGGIHEVDKLVTNSTEETDAELRKMEQMGIQVCRC